MIKLKLYIKIICRLIYNMTSNMNDQFDDILKNYVSSIADRGQMNSELEVKFGTRNIQKISKIQFDNVIQKLKSLGFTPNNVNGIYDLKIQSSYFDKNIQKINVSNTRTEINGLYNIQQYCRTNKLNLEHINISPLRFLQKYPVKNSKNQVFSSLNYDDFNFRISYNIEDILPLSNHNVIQTINTWENNKKIFRYMNRVSFYHDSFPVRVDCSVVKSSRKEHNKLIAEYNIQDANVFNNPISYEIEIEVLNEKIFGEFKDTKFLMASIKKVIKFVLTGLQNTNYPVGRDEINSVLENYQELMIPQDKRVPPYKLNSRNFIGPSNITLQISNLINNPDSNEPNILSNYTVTEKADGQRKMLLINKSGKVYLITTSMQVEFTGTICKNKDYFNTLLDGEHILFNKKGDYINIYAAFDIYFVNKKDVRNYDFIKTTSIEEKDKLTLRLIILNNLLKTPIFVSVIKEEISPLRIEVKKFYSTSKDISIFDGNKLILEKEKNGLFEYETDGLIFTPMLSGVGKNSDNEDVPNNRVTWNKCFKWKPPQFNTIDFLISTVKTNQSDKISLLYENGLNMENENQINRYKTLVLKVGFDMKKHGFLNPCESMLNGDFNTQKNRDDINAYQPMPFYPTNPYIENANICNVLLRPDENNNLQMFTKEDEVFEDNMIVEFSYKLDGESNWKWEPLRIRYDKTAEYRNNLKNYGNAYHVANSNWQSIHNPITDIMITTGSNIPEFIEENDIYYNRKNKSFNTQGLRDFHNLYIKKNLVDNYSKPGSILIDLSVGKAGDLPKWRNNNLQFVFGIDISKDNLENKLDGACARYLKSKQKYTNTPDCLFVHGNSSANITSLDAFYDEKAKLIYNSLLGKNIKDDKLIGKIASKYFGIAANGFDTTSCQFAIHYFFENNEILNQFLKNITNVTKLNGYFMATTYDGKTMFNKLKYIDQNSNITIIKDSKKIWEVTKLYNRDSFENNNSSVGYAINVFQESINKVFKEYLVNFDYLVRLFENYGFKLENTKLFEEDYNNINVELMSDEQRSVYSNILNMSDEEKSVSFLNRWMVFKKIRNVDSDKVYLEKSNENVLEIKAEEQEKQQAETIINQVQQEKDNKQKRGRKTKKTITIK